LTFIVGSGIPSNYTDDFPYSWSVPAYHPSTQADQLKKVCSYQCSFGPPMSENEKFGQIFFSIEILIEQKQQNLMQKI